MVGGPGDAGREITRACLGCRCVGNREGLGAFPRGQTAPNQALLPSAGTIAPLFAGEGRRVARCGGCHGEGCQVAGRAAAMPCPAQSCGYRWAQEREKKIRTEKLFWKKFSRKMCKTRRWRCFEIQGNVSLDHYSRRRKQKVLIFHSYAGGGSARGEVELCSVQVYVGYCAKRNYEVSQKCS